MEDKSVPSEAEGFLESISIEVLQWSRIDLEEWKKQNEQTVRSDSEMPVAWEVILETAFCSVFLFFDNWRGVRSGLCMCMYIRTLYLYVKVCFMFVERMRFHLMRGRDRILHFNSCFALHG